MTVNQEMNPTDNKTKQNKAQYYLERQAAMTQTLSSGNVANMNLKRVMISYGERGLLGKATTIKRFKYSPLYSQLKIILILQKNSTIDQAKLKE